MNYRTAFPHLMSAGLLLLAACGRTATPEAPRLEGGRPAPRPVVAAPLTGYAWDGQASVAAYKTTFDQAVNASVTALRGLGFSLDQKQSRRSLDMASLVGLNKEQRPARIDVRPLSQTRIEVRATVGPAGDRSSSERLLDELSKSLGKAD